MKYLILLAVCGFVACRTVPTDDSASVRSLFIGETRKAPISPIEHEGVDNSAPLPGAPIHIQSSALDTIVVSDASAHFKIFVPPGTYQIIPMELPEKWPSPPVGLMNVGVTGKDTLHISFVYETHIR
jgi:hypothetical protein